jgi:hypothetical protein
MCVYARRARPLRSAVLMAPGSQLFRKSASFRVTNALFQSKKQ